MTLLVYEGIQFAWRGFLPKPTQGKGHFTALINAIKVRRQSDLCIVFSFYVAYGKLKHIF